MNDSNNKFNNEADPGSVEYDLTSSRQARKQIRRRERLMRKEHKMSRNMPLGQIEGDPRNLKTELSKNLPPHMMPGNVGGINKVTWPMWNQVNFDFGTNPTYGPSTRTTQSFQNTQEAAFLLMSMVRKNWGYDLASDLAPLQIEIRDRQSSRQFNDRPIPLQMIGKRSHPTIFPTPLLIMPSAFIDVICSSWLTASQVSTGTGKFQISFFGYRIRTEDAGKVLSTVFG
jgi:hypothetical protein